MLTLRVLRRPCGRASKVPGDINARNTTSKYIVNNMELEDLDNINKSDFLPLLPHNIKEELLDAGAETANLVCDSVERQVKNFNSF